MPIFSVLSFSLNQTTAVKLKTVSIRPKKNMELLSNQIKTMCNV